MIIINIILTSIFIYLLIGFVFALVFVIRGVQQIDEGAHGGGWGFRVIIIPGCMIFWPLLLIKWMKVRNEIMKSAEE